MNKHFFVTKNSEETKKIASDFAEKLKVGDIVCLYGNLGAGKTTFVQGFAQGLGVEKRIISPTFVIIRSYKTASEQFYHADLYRLTGENELESTGLLDILERKDAIVAIEWPEKMGSLLPKKRWDVSFERIDDTVREITMQEYE